MVDTTLEVLGQKYEQMILMSRTQDALPYILMKQGFVKMSSLFENESPRRNCRLVN